MTDTPQDVTLLLQRVSDPADVQAREELFHLVKRVLYHIARHHAEKQGAGHTLQATALVDEAFCHLVNNQRIEWDSRQHFFRFAARQMWRILMEHAKRKRPEKLTPEQETLLADPEAGVADFLMQREMIQSVDRALRDIEQDDPSACEVLRTYWFVNWQFRFDQADQELVLQQAEPGRVRSFEKVGDLLGISHAKAQRLYVRAVKHLQKKLKAFSPKHEFG